MTSDGTNAKILSENRQRAVSIETVDQSKIADDGFINLINHNFTLVVVISMLYIFLMLSFLSIYMYVCYSQEDIFLKFDPPLEFIALAMGSLGAFFNMLLRYYNSASRPETENQNLPRINKLHILAILSLPTIIGAISGLIVYTILSGGLIRGPLFPEFACRLGEGKCNNFVTMIRYWSPNGTQSYVTAFLWCFIVGFSQRTMFGYLDRFINSRY